MRWPLSARVDLRNDRVYAEVADRQTRTAEEILRRLEDRPGVILADEVGMGKTYVALAVAVSVLEATRRKRPVIVMVPPAVADKWPKEWAVFRARCLRPGHDLRSAGPIRRGSDLLKLLDDPTPARRHIIFLTHGALTSSLTDPFVRLALLRQATLRRSDLVKRRKAVTRFAGSLLGDSRFADEHLVEALFNAPPAQWLQVWNRWRPGRPLDDDPVPFPLLAALRRVDLTLLRTALAEVPLNKGQTGCRSIAPGLHNYASRRSGSLLLGNGAGSISGARLIDNDRALVNSTVELRRRHSELKLALPAGAVLFLRGRPYGAANTTDGLWLKTFKRLCAAKIRPASLSAADRPRRMNLR